MFRILSTIALVAPQLASRLAAGLLFTPRGPRRSPRGDAFLATGVRQDGVVNGHRIALWRWTVPGGDKPVVVCLHGWGGSAAQFAAIAPALVACGHPVLAFDGPGHGMSTGRESSIVELRDVLLEIASRERASVSMVAHSGGGAAATLAMAAGMTVRRAVFVGPTVDPGALLEQSALAVGFSPGLLDGVKRRTEQRFGLPWAGLRLLPIASGRAEPLLVVHDREDAEVPSAEGVALARAWPRARLMLTSGLGHRRVLYDPGVVASVAEFISGTDL